MLHTNEPTNDSVCRENVQKTEMAIDWPLYRIWKPVTGLARQRRKRKSENVGKCMAVEESLVKDKYVQIQNRT